MAASKTIARPAISGRKACQESQASSYYSHPVKVGASWTVQHVYCALTNHLYLVEYDIGRGQNHVLKQLEHDTVASRRLAFGRVTKYASKIGVRNLLRQLPRTTRTRARRMLLPSLLP